MYLWDIRHPLLILCDMCVCVCRLPLFGMPAQGIALSSLLSIQVSLHHDKIYTSSSSSVFPATSLGFTILGEIFAY